MSFIREMWYACTVHSHSHPSKFTKVLNKNYYMQYFQVSFMAEIGYWDWDHAPYFLYIAHNPSRFHSFIHVMLPILNRAITNTQLFWVCCHMGRSSKSWCSTGNVPIIFIERKGMTKSLSWVECSIPFIWFTSSNPQPCFLSLLFSLSFKIDQITSIFPCGWVRSTWERRQ